MKNARLLLLCGFLFVGGCHTGTLPNPNDPKDVGNLSADNIAAQYSCMTDMLSAKLGRQMITEVEYKKEIQAAAESLLVNFNPDRIDGEKAWKVAQIMIDAKHWPDAKTVLDGAVEWAKINHNEDRRVNDSLRLARVLAELGDVPSAIKTARTTYGIAPEGAVPILYAVEQEITPAARGKGHDLELAKLVEDAIKIDLGARVDKASVPGINFLNARPVHVHDSWLLVVDLYKSAGRLDLAQVAQKNADATEIHSRHRRLVDL